MHTLKSFHSIGKYNSFITTTEKGLDKVVQDFINGPIIWCDVRSELGARALRHRSFIAAPGNLYSNNLLNKYKKRKWWRPVAPIILESYLHPLFENAYPSPFMLNNFVFRFELADNMPAILHIDNTARV